MQEKDLVHRDEKFEIVEGEIGARQAKSPVHERIQDMLGGDLGRASLAHPTVPGLSFRRPILEIVRYSAAGR